MNLKKAIGPIFIFFGVILAASSTPALAQAGAGYQPQVVPPATAPSASGPNTSTNGPAAGGAGGTPGFGNSNLPAGLPDSSAGANGSPSRIDDLLKQFVGPNNGEYFDGPTGASGEYFGPGVMEACGTPPAAVMEQFEMIKKFRAACVLAQRGDNQKIAVNDFSSSNTKEASYMYIMDKDGKCLGKTMVAFGNGAGGARVGCGDANSHLTPPGCHLTAVHNGSNKYNASNSLKMVGLQGQGSTGRGILIHATRAPGTSSTWGCAGVGYDAFKAVQQTLGYGALVCNFFQANQLASGCGNRRGLSLMENACQLDADSPSIPSQATGQGTPAVK
ncbi:MAG: hypothetical protein AB7F86_01145 [Bdellovibrionales bacterium]